ncbi:hypothetical protein Tco_0190375 [Tanacetum coccineum]
MVISSPGLTEIKNWLVQSKRLFSSNGSYKRRRKREKFFKDLAVKYFLLLYFPPELLLYFLLITSLLDKSTPFSFILFDQPFIFTDPIEMKSSSSPLNLPPTKLYFLKLLDFQFSMLVVSYML